MAHTSRDKDRLQKSAFPSLFIQMTDIWTDQSVGFQVALSVTSQSRVEQKTSKISGNVEIHIVLFSFFFFFFNKLNVIDTSCNLPMKREKLPLLDV